MKYHFIKQHDSNDCAAACMAMVCLCYKKEITISKLRDMMGTDLKGTNMIGLSKCADALGFVNKAVKVDKEGFLSRFTLPVIANVITKEGLSHFVVIYKISKKYVVIGDPAKELQRIDTDTFYKTFTGKMLLLKPDNRFVTGKDNKNTILKRYIRLLVPHKKLFILATISSILTTIIGIVSSGFNSMLYDEILPYQQKDILKAVMMVFLVINLSNTLIDYLRKQIMMFLSIKIDIPLMLGYFEHIYKLPMKFFAAYRTGDITTRFSDAFTIKDVFTSIALSLLLDISMAIIAGIILLKMNARLFVIVALSTLLSIALVYVFKQPYKQINEEQMEQSSILNSDIIESLRGIETIKCNADEDSQLESIEREYIKSMRIGKKETTLSNTQSLISSVISTAFSLGMTYIGITQVIDGDITLGGYMSFMTLSSYFTNPISDLIGMQLSIQEASISMKRLSEILDSEREQELADCSLSLETGFLKKDNETSVYNAMKSSKGNIRFENITFRYGNRNPVLKNINLEIPEGKKVAIVGESGSGKSTLVKLLLKYYEPEEGTISIDNIDIRSIDNRSLRTHISYVPQNIELFSKSIYDNIRISNREASFEEIEEAAKKADAHGFIQKLPMQYFTYLEEAGNGLSGGEKQRIALARAFLKDNAFYIFDESTSNLYFATENIVFDSIFNRLKGKTMLIIAHRLSTIKNCDKIIVLQNGNIIEEGTHEQLLKQGGTYNRLWKIQSGIETPEVIAENDEIQFETLVDENEIVYK